MRKKTKRLAFIGLGLVAIALVVGLLAGVHHDPMGSLLAGAVFFPMMGATGIVRQKKHLEGARKWPTKKTLVYLAQALNVNGMTPLGGAVPFPFGYGYLTMFLEIYITVTIGTGTGAISEGELLLLKNIYLRTDKHGPIIDNVCGRALYRRAQKIMHTAPAKDAMAAASATYMVSIPIYFARRDLRRHQDVLLDMADVKSMDLQITLGSVADLFTSVGTSSITVSADIAIEHTAIPVEEGERPVLQPYLAPINPQDPAVKQDIEIMKLADLGILDIMLFTSNSASAGIPWSGTPTANVLKRITLEDNLRRYFDNMPVGTIRNDNKIKLEFESLVTGLFILDLNEEQSIWQGLTTGGKAKVNINFITDTLSTSQISGLIDGAVSLK